jgi:acyl carrier protein
MDQATRQKILDLIQKEVTMDPATIDPDKDLREQVLLDSMQFVGIAARIEIELDIELPITVMEVSTLNQFLEKVEEEMKKKATVHSTFVKIGQIGVKTPLLADTCL